MKLKVAEISFFVCSGSVIRVRSIKNEKNNGVFLRIKTLNMLSHHRHFEYAYSTLC